MVADDLVSDLVTRYVRAGDFVLDPFCGTGRLLVAAAGVAARVVGLDVNPLAWLVANAKLGSPSLRVFEDLAAALQQRTDSQFGSLAHFAPDRKTEWFSPLVTAELSAILHWVNGLDLAHDDRLLVATALSAAVRYSSYARKSGWKLHRLAAIKRQKHTVSAWDRLEQRLQYCLRELRREAASAPDSHVLLGTAQTLADPGCEAARLGPYDVVLTSPPYGDSRTTVQYGAASSLCLIAVSQIKGFEDLYRRGREIDADCLG